MGSAAAGLLLAATLILAVACLGAWALLRRPARQLQRRQRAEALAAAGRSGTPARRGPAYGATAPDRAAAQAALDPCAPGLTDAQRVSAMRAMLQPAVTSPAPGADESSAGRDDVATTSPMAWRPTLPPEEMERLENQLPRRRRRPRSSDQDHEHVSLG